MNDTKTIITQSRNWIEKVVVGCNFCPFAARELVRKSIRFRSIEETDLAAIAAATLEECRLLDEDTTIETTLLILARFANDFNDYLECFRLAEDLLIDQDYEGVYQLASFHPQYRFANTEQDDAANYTNRSPYPMIHILREESVSRALENYPQAEDIPQKNIEYAHEKGLAYMKALRDSCF